jgi:hypothetical protein
MAYLQLMVRILWRKVGIGSADVLANNFSTYVDKHVDFLSTKYSWHQFPILHPAVSFYCATAGQMGHQKINCCVNPELVLPRANVLPKFRSRALLFPGGPSSIASHSFLAQGRLFVGGQVSLDIQSTGVTYGITSTILFLDIFKPWVALPVTISVSARMQPVNTSDTTSMPISVPEPAMRPEYPSRLSILCQASPFLRQVKVAPRMHNSQNNPTMVQRIAHLHMPVPSTLQQHICFFGAQQFK